MALTKYQNENMTAKDALNKLLHEHIYKLQSSNARTFRKQNVYTLEINALIKANLDGINFMFNKIKKGGSKFLHKDRLFDFVNDSYSMNEKELTKVYAFSKQSIQDEMTHAN
jgi:hypothetical protein